MPEDFGRSQFTEVLEVQVDVPLFRQGLAELEAEYKTFLDNVGRMGVTPQEVIDTGSVARLSTALRDLAGEITAIKTGTVSVLSDMREQIAETLTAMNEGLTTASKNRVKAEQSAEEQMEQLLEKEEARYQAHLRQKEAAKLKYDEAVAASDTRAEGFWLRRMERLESIEVAYRERIARANAQFQERQEREQDRTAAKEAANRERSARAHAQYLDRKEREEQRANEKSKKFMDDLAISNRKMLEQEEADERRSLQRRLAERQKLFDAGRMSYNAAYNEAFAPPKGQTPSGSAADVRLTYKQAYEEAYKVREQSARAYNQYVKEIAAQGRKVGDPLADSFKRADGVFGRFFNRLKKDIPELFAQILRYSLGFQLVFGAINAIQQAFVTVIGAFKQGIDYLSQLQERTADIKEALLENVVYSRDWAHNTQLAGQAAEYATNKIQEMSAKAAIPAEKIEAGLKALIQGGGLKLMNGDLNVSVELTTKLLSLMRARGVSETNQRRAVTEINNLMTGQVKESSVLLQVLNVNVETWKKVRQEALQTGDLLGAHVNAVETVGDRLRAVDNRLESAQDRWKDLNATLRTYSNILLGTMAKPVWDSLLGYLQQIKEYYEDHREEVMGIAHVIGAIAKMFIDIGISILKMAANTDILLFFARLSLYASLFAEGIRQAVHDFREMADADPKGLTPQKSWESDDDFEKRREKLKEKEEQAFKRETAERAAQVVRTSTAIEELKKGRISEGLERDLQMFQNMPNPLDYLIKEGTGDKGKAGKNDKVAELRREFDDQLREVKAEYNDAQEDLRQQLAEGQINRKEYHDERIKQLIAEKTRVMELTQTYMKLIHADGTGTDRAKGAAEASVKRGGESADLAAAKEIRDTHIKYTEDVKRAKLARMRDEVNSARAQRKELEEIDKASVQAGVMLESEYLQRKRQLIHDAHDEEVRLLKAERDATKDEFEKESLDRKLAASDREYTNELKRNTEERIAAVRKEAQERRNFANEIAKMDAEERIRQLRRQQTASGNPYTQINLEREILRIRIEQVKIAAQQAMIDLQNAIMMDVKGKVLDDLIKKAKELGLEWQKLVQAAEDSKTGKPGDGDGDGKAPTRKVQNIWTEIFGEQIESWDQVKERMSTFEGALDLAATALQNLPNILGGIMNAFKSGGAAGGIGAIMSTVGGFIPGPVGAVLQIGGGLLSMFSGLFGKAAKKIAAELKEGIDRIMKGYQRGTLSLSQTISALEAKRAESINRLSGKKGGSKELQKILEQIDDQLFDLRQKQKEIFQSFNEQLQVLRLHNDALGEAFRSWLDINKQVKEYLDAGGNAAKAAEFLSLSFEKLRQSSLDKLRDGESEAIQDALQLNDLLKQRQQLVDDFKKTEFEMLNQGALERRGSAAVSTGIELAKRRRDYEEQLAQIDSEIDRVTKRVEMEKEVFNLAGDTAALRARANELDLLSLQTQIEGWKELQKIVDGIVLKDGNWVFTDALIKLLGLDKKLVDEIRNGSIGSNKKRKEDPRDEFTDLSTAYIGRGGVGEDTPYTIAQTTTYNVDVNVTGGGDAKFAKEIAGEIERVLYDRGRSGLDTIKVG